MATRTISNTGGNYNAVGTWVEGIVPTSADDIVASAFGTSGQLTVNVASAARSIDLSNYNNTVTMNANWTISGVSLPHIFGSGMNFAGTVGFIIFSAASISITQSTTNRIPNLRFDGTSTKTLSTNMYCINFTVGTGVSVLNGNTIFISGNLGTAAVSTFVTQVTGTSVLYCDGNGFIALNITNPVTITGTYTTYGQSLTLYSGSVLTITGATLTNFNLILNKNNNGTDTYTINSDTKIQNLLILSSITNVGGRSMNINLSQNLAIDLLTSLPNNRIFTSDSFNSIISFLGSGLSASVVSCYPTYRINSSLTAPINTYKAPDLRFNSDNTHNIGNMMLIGGLSTDKPIISSITASSTASINLGSKITSQIVNYNFTDINAVGDEIVAINGTLTRTTNVTNVYPTGGGGVAGGSFTYVN